MTIGTKLFTWLNGQQVGTDELGNQYYVEKKAKAGRRVKRWVMYAGAPEPSSVPPEWHGWLHYTTDETPADSPRKHHSWQQPPRPNMSGTTEAYTPERQKNVADYEAWQPK